MKEYKIEITLADNKKVYKTVKAEDEISEKTYQINIHRRTEEEEKIAQKEAEEQREKLAKLLSTSQESEENKETENDEINKENEEKLKEEKNKILIWTVVSLIIIVAITIAVRYFFRKEKNRRFVAFAYGY